MSKGMVRILMVLGFILLAVLMISYIQHGTPWGLIAVFLGAILGPYLGLTYPFPFLFKTLYALGLLSCLVAFFLGLNTRERLAGQVLVVSSVVAWVALGIFGLGTGT